MRFLSATRLFSGKAFLEHGTILAIDDHGVIAQVLPAGSIEENRIERYEGILCPGFINSHCHLELSHLKNRIPRHTGIVDFGLSVIRQRNELPEEAQLEYMKEADRDMFAQGIVAVGDISNTALSAQVKHQSRLHYHSFVELIALNPSRASQVFDSGLTILETFRRLGLSASPAPHAPYSCSMELIRMITGYCRRQGLPTSIHNQESLAEDAFFQSKTGDYIRLYDTLGFPPDYFEATGKSSLQSILEALSGEVRTLLVHNTFTGQADIQAAMDACKHLYWCLCPHANLYIENTLPDASALFSAGCKLTLGTDSLASNATLSIWQEISILQERIPALPLEALLAAATSEGAAFLGISGQYGSFDPSMAPGINIIDAGKGTVKKLA